MIKKITLIITLLISSAMAFGFSSGGGTSSSDPYLVSNSDDLVEVRSHLGAGVYFKQTADIALSGNWTTPIGTSSSKFFGNYDGGGYKITGLSITATAAQQGLFGAIGSGSTVKNLGVENATITGSTCQSWNPCGSKQRRYN